MSAELVLPFKQAKNYHKGRVAQPRLIVIHFGVTPETPSAAEGMQNYFAGANAPQASAHSIADNNSLVRSVHDWDTAWGAPDANADGLHLEQAGNFQTRAQWLDDYSKSMITKFSAKQVADWAKRYSIPLRRLTVAQVADRKTKGVCGHLDVTNAFHTAGGHTDPGADYPYDVLLSSAYHLLGGTTPTPTYHNPYPQPTASQMPFTKGCSNGDRVKWLQWALGFTGHDVDGVFGDGTLASLKAFQKKHGLTQDGIVGPKTAAVLASVTWNHP